MKSIVVILISCLCLPFVTGCLGAQKNDRNLIDYKEDIRFFTRTAVRIVVLERKDHMQPADIDNVATYLDAAIDVIDNEEDPGFDDLRQSVVQLLPDQYKAIGLSVVDVLERYVLNHVLDNLDDKQKQVKELILSGLRGAKEGVSDASLILFEQPVATE